MRSHQQVVSQQFGSTAAAYLTSAVHAQGADLQELAQIAATVPGARVLDLGCGGGHASFAVAPVVEKVIAYDLSAEMLEVVSRAAQERGLDNLAVRQGSADRLEFPDASFELVCTRFSAHHWRHLPQALSEVFRVLKPGGRFIVIDTAAPADVLADTYVQAIELLRDTSHVRNVSLNSWRKLVRAAGFTIASDKTWKLRLEFASWVARMRTPPDHVSAIRALWQAAPQEVKQYFALEADDSFSIDVAMLELRKP
ncbi:ubiquinone/menaquinone biosynthesis C-methylase UbiE [Herbaspirillum rubrisubalbicans]|uniref:Class I SAM-dependent methyltransferase n=1 Tax=Herbaspirillum rubrisubalbicans Os34 TaxID=1235827 RepID=A0A6M3ZNZ0_9BURK|nr:class I SAM-dependent methyltransferase [Herbaspirillum rubrisubalbicans]MCP1571626.1 ubiquinone/menaquinone biosynthesis C-methylase UbiE [Herbaspirillum rubrisubalbicans]NQE51378.1 SAM-dependent methyltransferase [Herbaspirillum rubrisubalbicans]QJQ00334.1 class I SAM-dependent methyltransferase [Herbaspirillum rubrisubalbicans Os34]